MRTPASLVGFWSLLALLSSCGEQHAAGSFEARTQAALEQAQRSLEQASEQARAACERALAGADGQAAGAGAAFDEALDEFDAAIERLQADLERKGSEGKERLLRELQERVAAARARVEALQRSGAEDWRGLVDDVERESAELQRCLREALEQP